MGTTYSPPIKDQCANEYISYHETCYGEPQLVSSTAHEGDKIIVNEYTIDRLVPVPKLQTKETLVERVIVVPHVRVIEEYVDVPYKVRERVLEISKPIIQETVIEQPEREYRETLIPHPYYYTTTNTSSPTHRVPTPNYRPSPVATPAAVVERPPVVMEHPVPRVVECPQPPPVVERRPPVVERGSPQITLTQFSPITYTSIPPAQMRCSRAPAQMCATTHVAPEVPSSTACVEVTAAGDGASPPGEWEGGPCAPCESRRVSGTTSPVWETRTPAAREDRGTICSEHCFIPYEAGVCESTYGEPSLQDALTQTGVTFGPNQRFTLSPECSQATAPAAEGPNRQFFRSTEGKSAAVVPILEYTVPKIKTVYKKHYVPIPVPRFIETAVAAEQCDEKLLIAAANCDQGMLDTLASLAETDSTQAPATAPTLGELDQCWQRLNKLDFDFEMLQETAAQNIAHWWNTNQLLIDSASIASVCAGLDSTGERFIETVVAVKHKPGAEAAASVERPAGVEEEGAELMISRPRPAKEGAESSWESD